jgi:hypothetical protein
LVCTGAEGACIDVGLFLQNFVERGEFKRLQRAMVGCSIAGDFFVLWWRVLKSLGPARLQVVINVILRE